MKRVDVSKCLKKLPREETENRVTETDGGWKLPCDYINFCGCYDTTCSFSFPLQFRELHQEKVKWIMQWHCRDSWQVLLPAGYAFCTGISKYLPEVELLYSRLSCVGFGSTLCLCVGLRCKSPQTGLAFAFSGSNDVWNKASLLAKLLFLLKRHVLKGSCTKIAAKPTNTGIKSFSVHSLDTAFV